MELRPARPEKTGWPYLLDYQIHNGGHTPRLRAHPGDSLWCRAHEGLHVRSGPHTHANIVALLRIGEHVKCLQCQEWDERRVQWARIRTHDGIEGWAAAGWLSADYVRPAIGVKDLIAPPSLYAALCRSQRLLAAWKRSTAVPRILLAIAALESDVRTRDEYGGMLVSRFEEVVFDRLRKTVSNDEARLQSTSWGVMQVMGFHFNAPYYAGQFRECRDWVEWLGADTDHEWLAGANVLLTRCDDEALESLNWTQIAMAYNGAGERTEALAQHRTPYDHLLAERYAQASVMTYEAYTQEDRDMAKSNAVPPSKPLPPDDHSTRAQGYAASDQTPPIPPKPDTVESLRAKVAQQDEIIDHYVSLAAGEVTGKAVSGVDARFRMIYTVLHAITLFLLVVGGLHFQGRMGTVLDRMDQGTAQVADALGDKPDRDYLDQALSGQDAGLAAHAKRLGDKLDLQDSTIAAIAAPPTPIPYITVLTGLNYHSAPQISGANKIGTWNADTHIQSACKVQGTVIAHDTGNPIVTPVVRVQESGIPVYAVFRDGDVNTLSYGPTLVPDCH